LTFVSSKTWFTSADIVIKLGLADSSILAWAFSTHIDDVFAVAPSVPFTADARVAVDTVAALQRTMFTGVRCAFLFILRAALTFVASATLAICHGEIF